VTCVLYVENLAAAEKLVRRGQFNAAKVLRALAHAQRSEAMTRARHDEVDLPELLRRNHAALTDPAARDIAARALASLAHHTDVAESDVNQHIWGCYGCGRLVEGDRPDSCPACGALAVEFEWFGPFYAANPEHLGQQSPATCWPCCVARPTKWPASSTDAPTWPPDPHRTNGRSPNSSDTSSRPTAYSVPG